MSTRIALRTAALGYLTLLVLVPLAMIFYRTFEDGIVAFFESVTTPAAISAISLSLTVSGASVRTPPPPRSGMPAEGP